MTDDDRIQFEARQAYRVKTLRDQLALAIELMETWYQTIRREFPAYVQDWARNAVRRGLQEDRSLSEKLSDSDLENLHTEMERIVADLPERLQRIAFQPTQWPHLDGTLVEGRSPQPDRYSAPGLDKGLWAGLVNYGLLALAPVGELLSRYRIQPPDGMEWNEREHGGRFGMGGGMPKTMASSLEDALPEYIGAYRCALDHHRWLAEIDQQQKHEKALEKFDALSTDSPCSGQPSAEASACAGEVRDGHAAPARFIDRVASYCHRLEIECVRPDAKVVCVFTRSPATAAVGLRNVFVVHFFIELGPQTTKVESHAVGIPPNAAMSPLPSPDGERRQSDPQGVGALSLSPPSPCARCCRTVERRSDDLTDDAIDELFADIWTELQGLLTAAESDRAAGPPPGPDTAENQPPSAERRGSSEGRD